MGDEVTAAAADAETVVDESVSHFRVEKLANDKVRVSAGGHVVVDETFWKALQRFAETEQQKLEDKPDHLKNDQWDSISWCVVNPEIDDGLANDAEWVKEEVLSDVREGEETLSRSGAWLAVRGDTDLDAHRIDLYRLWDAEFDYPDGGDSQ